MKCLLRKGPRQVFSIKQRMPLIIRCSCLCTAFSTSQGSRNASHCHGTHRNVPIGTVGLTPVFEMNQASKPGALTSCFKRAKPKRDPKQFLRIPCKPLPRTHASTSTSIPGGAKCRKKWGKTCAGAMLYPANGTALLTWRGSTGMAWDWEQHRSNAHLHICISEVIKTSTAHVQREGNYHREPLKMHGQPISQRPAVRKPFV